MSERDLETLSKDGQARRVAMLDALLGEMREMHARRRMRRRATVIAAAGLVLAGAIVMAIPRSSAPPAREVAGEARERATEVAAAFDQRPESDPVEPQRVAVNARIVRTDPSVTQRYLVRTGEHRAIVLSDDELIATLEAIGRPAGLVRLNGEAWLTAKVTDEELDRRSPTERDLHF